MGPTLTDDGLVIQTVDEIRAELVAAYTDPSTGVDPDLDTSDDSIFGRIIGLRAIRERSIQEQMLAVYTALGPDATGVSLTRVALLTGTVRAQATYSLVELSVTLAAGVTLPAGSRANVDGDPNAVFETLSDVTNSGGSPATLTVDAQALEAGPIAALAGTITVRTTPVVGWTAVTNAADAAVGDPAETDPVLRVRRVQELNSGASTNLAAIVTDVRALPFMFSAAGYENTTSGVDVDGLPPHSFEIVVYSLATPNNSIAQAIWDSQPAGIAAVHGTAGSLVTGTAVDVLGNPHTLEWTAADEVPVYFDVELLIDADEYPADGDAQVKAALVAYVNNSRAIGSDVVVTKLYSPIYSNVPGIEDITSLKLGTSPSPSGTTNITIGSRALAVASTANITVTSIPG